METEKTKKKKELIKFFVVVFAALFLAAVFALPTLPGLSEQGKNTIGLTVFFLILLIARPVPLPVVCLMLIAAMPFATVRQAPGVKPEIVGALAGFTSSVPYFTVASFALSYAFVSAPLSNRILKFLLTRFAKSTGSMLLSVMISGVIISSVISNIPGVALMIALSTGILKTVSGENPNGEQRKKLGRALIMGNIYAGMIGGMATPAGSSLNMLAIGFLRDIAGVDVSFAQWMLVCVPIVAVLIPAAWLIILRIHKPPELSGEELKSCAESIEVPEEISANEFIFIIIFGLTILFWILSSWIPVFDVTMIAIVSACICFLPGLDILHGKKFEEFAKWDVFFVQGTAISLGFAMTATGADKWFADLFLYALPDSMPMYALIAICSLFVFFMLLLIPIAPAMITIFSVQFISLAALHGISPVPLIMVLALCTSNCYLLPLDTVPLLGLETGYYSAPEMMKSSILLQILIVLLLSLWIPVCVVAGII